MGSQDGGGPWLSQRWEGQTSAREVLHERAQALLETLKHAPSPRYLVADGTVSHEDQAAHWPAFGCLPRLPQTRTIVSQGIRQALARATWPRREAPTGSQRLA